MSDAVFTLARADVVGVDNFVASASSAASGTAGIVVSPVQGRLYRLLATNASAVTSYFVQVFNAATAPVNGATPVLVRRLPASGSLDLDLRGVNGLVLGSGISIALSTTAATLTLAGSADLGGWSAIYTMARGAPTIAGLNYTLGDPGGGGQSIVITGTNLDTTSSVTFGGTAATITARTPTTCTVTLPARAAGVVDVVVVNGVGAATATSAFEFWSPASLALSGWWRASYAGLPWSGNASAGASAGRNLTTTGNDPTTGTAQGGFTPADFATTKYIASGVANNVFFGASGSVFALIYARTAPAHNATAYANGNLFSDNTNAETTFGVTSSGLNACVYDGGGYKELTGPACSTGAWHLAQFKFDGTNLKARVDGGAWSSTACASPPYLTPSNPQVGRSYANAIQFDGLILEIGAANSAVADASFDKMRSYCAQRYGVSV